MRRRHFRKLVFGIGLILLVAGAVSLVYPDQENYTETVPVRPPWNVPPTLAPYDSTSYGAYMPSKSWFQLNISASNSIKVTASYIIRDPDPRKVPFFEQTGNSFHQRLAGGLGTSYIDIENENSFAVTLQGNVLMEKEAEGSRIIYPYVIPGFLLVLGGTGALMFGVFRTPKRSKPKGAYKRET